MIPVLKKIFSKPKNSISALAIMIAIVVLFLSIPQFSVITRIFSLFSVGESRFWTSEAAVLAASFAVLSSWEVAVLLLLAFLTGVNSVIFIVYLKQYKKQLSFAGTNLTFAAMVLGVFGVGCLSCGVLLIAPIVSIFGFSAALWVTEYGILMSLIGCLLVAYSSYFLLKKITNPQVCEVLS